MCDWDEAKLNPVILVTEVESLKSHKYHVVRKPPCCCKKSIHQIRIQYIFSSFMQYTLPAVVLVGILQDPLDKQMKGYSQWKVPLEEL